MMLVKDVCPARALVAQFHADRKAMLFQCFEGAIDGRGIDHRVPLQDLDAELIDAAMTVFRPQDLEDGDARTGGLKTVGSQDGLDGIHTRIDGHPVFLSNRSLLRYSPPTRLFRLGST